MNSHEIVQALAIKHSNKFYLFNEWIKELNTS